MLSTRESWKKWLDKYGADNFFDAFMRNAQGARSHCRFCGEEIYLDIAIGGGIPDWGSGENGGDFDCTESPDTNDEGTGAHMPLMLEE